MNRRDLLKMLGIGAVGLAFAPHKPWIFTENLVPIEEGQHIHEIGPGWFVAEAIARLNERFPRKLELMDRATPSSHIFGIQFNFESMIDAHRREMPLHQIRERYIVPPVDSLAVELEFADAHYSIPLELPMAVDQASRVTDEVTGKSMRFCRFFDPEHGRFLNRFDLCVA